MLHVCRGLSVRRPPAGDSPRCGPQKCGPISRWSAKVTATCTSVSHWPAMRCAFARRRRLHPLLDVRWSAFFRRLETGGTAQLWAMCFRRNPCVVKEHSGCRPPNRQVPAAGEYVCMYTIPRSDRQGAVLCQRYHATAGASSEKRRDAQPAPPARLRRYQWPFAAVAHIAVARTPRPC
jgi:hypothetical protein